MSHIVICSLSLTSEWHKNRQLQKSFPNKTKSRICVIVIDFCLQRGQRNTEIWEQKWRPIIFEQILDRLSSRKSPIPSLTPGHKVQTSEDQHYRPPIYSRESSRHYDKKAVILPNQSPRQVCVPRWWHGQQSCNFEKYLSPRHCQ